MSNQSEDIQAVGFDTRPPMLDRTDFESWQQRIRLYYKGKDHGKYILQSIGEGSFKMRRCRDEIASGTDGPYLGPERDRVVDNVKMLLEGFELTKDDRKSQLYDEFEHFSKHKGENIHDYYVRFTKLINDIRHIKMTMPKNQLNSKFESNMLPEWGRFVMVFKLNKGLKESNHDQLGDITWIKETMLGELLLQEIGELKTELANISSAEPIYDEAGPSYDFGTLSEDNEALVVQSDASSIPNDALMMIANDIYEEDA
nr:hypothetical protein [Tanacetum cinerariifolium]